MLVMTKSQRLLGLQLVTAGLLTGTVLSVGWLALRAYVGVVGTVSLRDLEVGFGCGYVRGALAVLTWRLGVTLRRRARRKVT